MLNVYYRVPDAKKGPQLYCITADTDDYKEAISAVMEQLHATAEVFLKPVVVLIHGGKR